MGFRWHLYRLNKKQLRQLSRGTKGILGFDDAVCVERNKTFSDVYSVASPLKLKQASCSCEDGYQLKVLTKAQFRCLISGVFDDFQQHIIDSLLYPQDFEKWDITSEEVQRRCLYAPTDEDEHVRRHCGVRVMQVLCAAYCRPDSKEKFMDQVGDKDSLIIDRTMYDILLQLVYIYKTWSDKQTLVIVGW